MTRWQPDFTFSCQIREIFLKTIICVSAEEFVDVFAR